jgi:hypothetical protein
VNVLPSPGVLLSWISPPSKLASSRLMARPRPGSAVLAAGPGIGLLERLEDDPLLFQRDADAAVAHLEGQTLDARFRTDARAPAADRGATPSRTPPVSVNLNAFESSSSAPAARAWCRSSSSRRDARSMVDLRARCLRMSASWRNGRATPSTTLASATSSADDRHGSGFDLGQVENFR